MTRIRLGASICFASAWIAASFALALLSADAQAQTFTWNVDGNGNWNVSGNWDPNTGFPNAPGSIVNLTNDISADATIMLPGSAITIGQLHLGDSGSAFHSFNLNGGGSFTFDATSGNALINKASTASEVADRISAAIILADNLDINNDAVNAGLTIAGGIGQTGGARTVTKTGAGAVTLSGTNTYTGETYLDGGTLNFSATHTTGDSYRIAVPSGTSATLNVTGGAITTSGGFWVGEDGNGVLNQTAGDIQVSAYSSLGRWEGSTGEHHLSGGSFTSAGDYNVGDFGTGTYHQTGGSLTTTGGKFVVGYQATSTGNVATIDDGTITTNGPGGNGWVDIGRSGEGTLIQNGGTITVNGINAFGMGRFASGEGTFIQNGGTVEVPEDWFLVARDGKGTASQFNNGVINTRVFTIAQNAGSVGTFTQDAPDGEVNVAADGDVLIGLNGTGTYNLHQGIFRVEGPPTPGGSADFSVGEGATGIGTVNQMGGSIVVDDWTYIGFNGTGTFNMSGGTYSGGDNFSIGHNDQSDGQMIMSSGQLTVVGNDPTESSSTSFGTGNLLLGRYGNGTLEVSGDAEITTGALGNSLNTYNSISYSSDLNPALPDKLRNAKDGNLFVGERTGVGVLDQSGGTINVGANVFVGGADFSDPFNIPGGTGTLNISGGQMIVGAGSPTGGDLVLGSFAFAPASKATVNLSGGLLDVSHSVDVNGETFGGNIGTGGGGNLQFNFTGGTLKVRVWNNTDAGGNLGPLVQSGATSKLDVTGNNTELRSGYQLSQGRATVGVGRLLEVQGALNVSGGGTIETAGLVHVDGNANFASGGQVQWQLAELSTTPGDDFGFITVDGNLVLDGTSSLVLDFSLLSAGLAPDEGNVFWNSSQSWKIIDAASNPGDTSFASVVGGIGPGTWSVSVGTGADLGDIFLNYALSLLAGDFDGDGFVGAGDLDLVLGNWGDSSVPASWVNFVPDGIVGADQLDAVLGNWGEGTPPMALSAVPEPSAGLLGLTALGFVSLLRRRGGTSR